MDETSSDNDSTGMSPEEKRRDQLLSAPGSVESDADPRIVVSEHDGVKRIDIAPDATVRPGNPYDEPAQAPDAATDDDGSLEGPDIETPSDAAAPHGDALLAKDGGSGSGADSGDGTESDGTAKPGGLGQDGTIPSDPSGVAAGHTGELSTFEPEEDEDAPA